MNYLEKGLEYKNKQKYHKALQFFRLGTKLSQTNDQKSECMYCIARLYYKDLIDDPNYNQAEMWYVASIQLGNPKAICDLGTMYFYGHSVKQNYTTAFNLYQNAADLKQPTAINNLAYMRKNGLGCTKNLSKANELFKTSASNGDMGAMVNLGKMEEDRSNFRGAIDWYEKAANLGNGTAIYRLEKIMLKMESRSRN